MIKNARCIKKRKLKAKQAQQSKQSRQSANAQA